MPNRRCRRRGFARAFLSISVGAAHLLSLPIMMAAQQPVSLQECVETALANNRALQIEKVNPLLARLAVDASYGYYDPVFIGQTRKEEAEDTGGFDPTDFSRDAIYSAESETASAAVAGFLPSGLNYSLDGAYAHSEGTRNGLNFDSYKVFSGITVRQPLLRNFWTDEGRTAIKINRKLLKISELGVQYVIEDVLNQVEQAYYELAFGWEELQIRQRLLNAKESTLMGVRRQVEVGSMTAMDEILARSQASRVAGELVAASNLVALAENQLRSLLGHGADDWVKGTMRPSDLLVLVPADLELLASWRRGYAQRADLAQLRTDIERADIDLKFRRNQLFPSLDVIAGYGRRGSSATQSFPPVQADASLSAALDQVSGSDAPNAMVGVVFSTPLGYARERANYRAGRHLKEQAHLRLKQKEEMVLREVSDAYHNARLAYDRAQANRHARDQARAALQAEEQKLAGGKSSLFFVLQLQSDLAAAESAELRARADYNKALSQLHFAEGTGAERRRFRLEPQ